MKSILLTAAALLIAAPAYAYPQWLNVAKNHSVAINYNTVRVSAKGVRIVDVSVKGVGGITMFVACDSWRYALQGVEWKPISAGSSAEHTAYIVCPGPLQQNAIKSAQGYYDQPTGETVDY